MFDPLIILLALGCGIVARALGLPALVGYLAAGFALYELAVRRSRGTNIQHSKQ